MNDFERLTEIVCGEPYVERSGTTYKVGNKSGFPECEDRVKHVDSMLREEQGMKHDGPSENDKDINAKLQMPGAAENPQITAAAGAGDEEKLDALSLDLWIRDILFWLILVRILVILMVTLLILDAYRTLVNFADGDIGDI
ncbi:hypothetical protein POM88_031485 [Heracleum sosnowskyi]|uniref:Uncharacterized protein n=1 Tax=Heracleum sosnowskyi TaxID=360622 RepID=A0AAD8HXI9_9APIA|nr:hypothetical protein POM88_031482 [Heracleum sosnowskyi]KAK1375292.1 hypothetical protein POM88_031485 [Heracleum sosnowskyi]